MVRDTLLGQLPYNLQLLHFYTIVVAIAEHVDMCAQVAKTESKE